MSWDIAFAGFVTYNHTTWDIALVQKGRKEKAFGDIATESIFDAKKLKCNIKDVQL